MFFSLSFFISCDNSNYNNLDYKQDTKKLKEDYSDRVNTVQIFYKSFAQSYKKVFNDSIPNFTMWDSLPFGNPFKAKLTLYLSNTRETFLNVDKEGYPKMEIKVSDLPIQLMWAYGLDTIDSPHLSYKNLSGLLKEYDSLDTYFNFSNGQLGIFSDITIESFQIYFDVRNNGFVVLENINLERIALERRTSLFSIPGIGFLTSINGFEQWKDSAHELGKIIAAGDIFRLFTTSYFFRKVLANKYLQPKAQEIIKKTELNKDKGLKYPIYEFQRDINDLKETAIKHGLGPSYTDTLLQYEGSYKPKSLIIAYESYEGFMIQWIGINILLIICIVFFKRKQNLIKRKTKNISLQTIVIVINGWIFNQKPEFISFEYCLLPGFLFILCLCVVAYNFHTKKFDFKE